MANATDERVASPEPVMFGASFKEVYDVNDLVITTIFTLEVVLDCARSRDRAPLVL